MLFKGLAPLAAALALLPMAGAQELRLRYKFEEGVVHHYRLTLRTTFESPEVKKRRKTSTHTMDFTREVLSVEPDGSATLRVTFTRFRLQGSDTDFDTERGDLLPYDPRSDLFHALVGKPLTARIGATGRILELKGIDEIVNQVAAKLLKESPQLREQVLQMKRDFTAENFKSQFEQFMPPVPEEPLGVGSSWKHEYTGQGALGESTAIRTTFTVESLGQEAVIGAEMVMDGFTGRELTLAGRGRPAIFDMASPKAGGTIRFSLQHGRVVHCALSLTADLTMRDKPDNSGPIRAPSSSASFVVKSRSTLEEVSGQDSR